MVVLSDGRLGVSPELCGLSAAALCRMIRTRDVSAREVAEAFLARIDAVNPRHNAIVSRVPHEEVLRAADAADAAVSAGEAVGSLHGLPMAIKDTANTRGLRSTYGSPLFVDNV